MASLTRRRALPGLGGLALLCAVQAWGAPFARAGEPAATPPPAGASNTTVVAPVVTWATPNPPPSAAFPVTVATSVGGAPALAPAPNAPLQGLAVVAVGETDSIAWPLAKAVYADAALRPSFDEARARILAGAAPPADASVELRDLAETRAAIHGQDAPSRQLLGALASSLRVSAIVVVQRDGDGTGSARVFLAATGAFDAARYAPDDGSGVSWKSTVESLHRAFGPVVASPAVALTPVPFPPRPEDHTRVPFYRSPWFWGALGAAAFGAGAVYFATRDNSPDTIHLQVQVPK